MTKAEMLKPLIDFNRRANEINKSEFCKFIYDNNNVIQIDYKDSNLTVKREGPTLDNIKAFTLDFRFFIQDKDTSFKELAKHYNILPIPNDFKQLCNDLRDGFNNFLDNGFSNVKYEDKKIKFRDLMWTFVYGKLAHENEEYIGTVKNWTSNEIIAEFLWSDLILIFSGGFRNINALKNLNGEVINYINKNIN